jgi:hypothetical protein
MTRRPSKAVWKHNRTMMPTGTSQCPWLEVTVLSHVSTSVKGNTQGEIHEKTRTRGNRQEWEEAQRKHNKLDDIDPGRYFVACAPTSSFVMRSRGRVGNVQ